MNYVKILNNYRRNHDLVNQKIVDIEQNNIEYNSLLLKNQDSH